MSDDEIRLPETDPPPDPAKKGWTPLPPLAPLPPPEPPSGLEGCFAAGVKVIAILILGVFVLAGLILATCFLGARR